MSSDVCDGGSVLAIVAEKLKDEILKGVGQVLSTGLLPVGGIVALEEQVVEILVLFGLLEWEDALDNDEQNDTSGEHVDLSTVVVLAFLDLGSHVGHGASVRLQIVDFSEGSKAEIGDLQIHALIDQDVFKFEVSVNDSFSVHVLENITHLRKEETATVFSHSSESLTEIKEETAGNKLEKNVNEVANLSS